METIDKIRDFIAKGETEKAIELLVQHTKENKSPNHDEAVLLSGQFRQWQREVTLGVQQSNSELRRIEVGIMNILAEKEKAKTQSIAASTPTPVPANSSSSTTTSAAPKKSNLMPILVGVLGIALLGMGYWMMNHDKESEKALTDSTKEPVEKPVEKPTKTPAKKPTISNKLKPIEKTTINNEAIKNIDKIKPTNIPKITPEVLTNKLPKVNGKNVNLVTFFDPDTKNNRYFRNVGNKRWVEEFNDFKLKFNYVETGRDDFSVFLLDKARNVKIQINLHTKKIMYADKSNSKFREIFSVKNSQNIIKGKYARKVIADNGNIFELTRNKNWKEYNPIQNKEIDKFKEYQRDEWSIYLRNDAKLIQLDLYSKEVKYAPKGQKVKALYKIKSSF